MYEVTDIGKEMKKTRQFYIGSCPAGKWDLFSFQPFLVIKKREILQSTLLDEDYVIKPWKSGSSWTKHFMFFMFSRFSSTMFFFPHVFFRGDKSELEGVPEWILKDAVELALQAHGCDMGVGSKKTHQVWDDFQWPDATKTRWWFEICFIFTPTWGNDPIRLMFLRWVQ